MKTYTIEGRDSKGRVVFKLNMDFESDEYAKQMIREDWDRGYYNNLFSVCLSEGDRPILQTIKNITI